MAIRNISAELGNSISGVSSRVRSIGRNISERPAGPFVDKQRMIGMDVARIGTFTQNLGHQGTNVGFAGSRVGANPFFMSSSGFNSGAVQDAASYYTHRRFGRMDSNLGFNRIPGFQRGPRF